MADVLSAPGPHGLAASRQQALGTRVIEHVDRSDLVQRPDPPDRQVGCLRGSQRLLEGRTRRGQVAEPVGPADDLQGVAASLGVHCRRRCDAVGQAAGQVGVVGRERDLRLQ
jgi:hypothetical protein